MLYLIDMLVQVFFTGSRGQQVTRKDPFVSVCISSCNVQLPESWPQLIALDENNADLACFLTDVLTKQDIPDRIEFIAGGVFHDDTKFGSSKIINVTQLHSNHVEGDTRMILHAHHALNTGYERIIVASADTDVMVLLLHS